MLPLNSLAAFAVLWGSAASNPLALEQLASRKTFTLQQTEVQRSSPWHGPNSMRRAYMKYGLEVPETIETAARFASQGPPGQTSIGVRPVKGDVEFLIN